MRTATKSTYQLQDGDIIQTHGSRFLVGSFKMADTARYCTGQYLGPVGSEADEAIRRAFGVKALHSWTIQGNDKATWTVEA